LNFRDAGSDVVVVTAHPSEIGGQEWPDETSTVIRFHEGKVVSMQDYPTEAEALTAAQWRRGPHVPAGVIALDGSPARSTFFACAVGPSVAAISTSTNRRRTSASENRAVPALPRPVEPRFWNCRRRTSAGIREYHLAMIRQACTGCGCDQCPCPDCTKR
jgi:hypothetical protein